MTLKDLSNLHQKTNQGISKNGISEIVAYLNQKEGSTVDVMIDSENNFKAIFYQDQYMKKIYETYPEILLVDATYKLLELRLPVYLLLVIDGDGLSEIAALFVLADELKSTVENIVKVLRKHNELWTETKVIMSYKDFVVREAFSKCFANASLLICLYHTLRSFRREVTRKKMGITSAERLRCLEIIQLIAYSKTTEHYTEKLEMLKNTKLDSVISYFMENWDPIKNQWVFAFKDSHMNLGQTTNNRLESTFNKLKSVCSKYASLMQFFLEFFTFLGAIRNDRNRHHLMTLSRKEIALPCAAKKDEIEYLEQLTPYAFSFLRKQL